MKRRKRLYCKFCGSSNLTNIRVNIKQTRTKEFKPQVSYEKASASAGSIGRKKVATLSYISKFCKLCRNIDAADPSEVTIPIEAYSSELKKTIIIPHILATHLKTIEYEPEEMVKLISKIKEKLETFYNKWSITGVNPCGDEHVGKKIEVRLKHGVEIMCWVIVDSLKDKAVLRLSYGGGKITCPES